MRQRSETWSKMAARGRFQMETKARIANKDYTAISAPVISRSLMSSPLSVGNCTSATLTLSILTDDPILAENPITIMGRLTSEGQYSEWLEFGTFYINQRNTSYEGLITVDCYDAMLKANQSYLESDDTTGWPKSMKEVVEEIAYRIGVGIDPRTRINTGSDYVVSAPTGKTMVQVLGYIGACHGGNWIITEENLLRLVPLIPIADETFHIIDADYARIKAGDGSLLAYQLTEETTKLPEQGGEQPSSAISVVHHITDELGQPIVTADGHYLIWAADGQVTAVDGIIDVPVVCGELTTGTSITVTGISASNENGASFTTGNDSGFVLSIESNPYMTQKICDDLCVAFEGLVYAPYTATKACYDPATELGDQVKIGDKVRSVLYGTNIRFDLDFRSDMSAPNSEELSEEYPFLTEYKRLLQSTVSLNTSIQKIAEDLTKTVEASSNDVTALSQTLSEEIVRASGVEQELSTRIGKVENRTTTVEERTSALGTANTALNERVNTLEEKVAAHDETIAGIEADSQTLAALKTKVDSLSDQVAENTNAIATLTAAIDEHTKLLTDIQAQLDELIGGNT